jgi:ABC-type multidrug transport system fused ATPase/permease subunit
MNGTLRLVGSLLTPRDRRIAAMLCMAMFVSAILECIGLGLVLPVLALLSNDASVLRHVPDFVARVIDTMPRGWLIVLAMAGLLLIYIAKAAFRWMLVQRLNRFGFRLQRELSTRLFQGFISRPWQFHLGRNSTGLLHGVTHDCDQVALGIVVPALVAVSEGLVIAAITVFLLVIEPTGGVICLALLGSTGWWFHHKTEARASALGQRRRECDRSRFRLIRQALEGVKEIQALGREQGFTDLVDAASVRSGTLGARVQSLKDTPRSWFEVLAILGLAALVSTMALRGRDPASVIGVAGIFAIAVLRIVPSGTRLMSSIQSMILAAPSARALAEELAQHTAPAEAAPGDHDWSSIDFQRVSFHYSGDRPEVLADLDARFMRGESVGLIGSSGSGKSTVVDLALGLLEPSAGRIMIGRSNLAMHTRWWRAQVGYVPQSIYLLDDTIRRNVAFGLSDRDIDDAAVAEALERAQVSEFVASLPDGVSTMVGERGVRLSGGQRQRLGVARALYGKPSVLILDEATSALDSATEAELVHALHALHGKVTMIVVAHREATVAHCDRVFRLVAGQLVEVNRE